MGGMDLRRGARWLGIVAGALGLAAATALAAPPTVNFTVTPNPPNQGEPALFQCQPCSQSPDVEWDFDEDPDFERSGRSVTTTFDTAGPHTVRMRATWEDERSTITKTVIVNAPPTVAFDFDPSSPLAGEEVNFSSQVSDPEGNPVSRAWTFGDGESGIGAAPSHVYEEPGTYTVTVTATDSNGASSTASDTIVVRPDPDGSTPPPDASTSPPDASTPPPDASTPPPDASTPSTSPPGELIGVAPRLRMMSPFPVVRIAGTVMRDGARISVLSVRAPRGSRVRVRCEGRGCPVGSVARTAATRLVRFRKFERRLRAGIRLKLFVRQGDRIGKYTRFLIRAGAPPKRLDLCLFPGRARPARCP
jgi:PKD repeat protein